MSEGGPVTELLLSTGERVEVEGRLEEVEEKIVSASRGAMMELARLVVASSGATIAVNPGHVVALREPR
jgi:hypothetical protein